MKGSGILLAADDKSDTPTQEQRRRPDNSLGFSFEHQPSDEFDLKKYSFNGRIKPPFDSPLNLFIDTRGEVYDTETDHEFPERLYSLSLSLLAQNRMVHALVGVSDRGDRPFSGESPVNLYTFTFYNIVPTLTGGFFLGVVYFPFERLVPEEIVKYNTPFPFFMYQYNTPGLSLNLSIPTFFRWAPARWFNATFLYIPTYNFTATATLIPHPLAQVAIEGYNFAHNFYLAERKNRDEKLYLDTSRVSLRLTLFYTLEAAAGWSFRGRYYSGESYSDDAGAVDIGRSFYYRLALRRAF